MRRLEWPLTSNPRISRSRALSVRTRNSTLGSRTGRGGSAGVTGALEPSSSLRTAAATCHPVRSLARKPSAPASMARSTVSRRVAVEQPERLLAVARDAEHLDIVLSVEDHAETLREDLMVIGQ